MIGADRPGRQGINFDWARQDTKPGLMNLNLIIDEEAFFSRLRPAEHRSGSTRPCSIRSSCRCWPHAERQRCPYTMPLSNGPTADAVPPIPLGGPPVPLVVSAIQATGAPNYVYPITDQTQIRPAGFPGQRPDPAGDQRRRSSRRQRPCRRRSATGSRRRSRSSSGCGTAGRAISSGTAAARPARIAPWSTPTVDDHSTTPGRSRPSARSARCRFPDINYTIMRPAALPPRPTATRRCSRTPADPQLTPSTNAQALLYT